MVAVAAFAFTSNALAFRASHPVSLAFHDTDLIAQTVGSISPYTPVLAEHTEQLKITLNGDAFVGSDAPATLPSEYLHVVEKGESLASIAAAYSVYVSDILSLNQIKPEDAARVSVGTRLRIPATPGEQDLTWLSVANEARRRAEQEAARLAAARRTRLATAVQSFRERSALGYGGSFAGRFILPIRHNGISRGISWFHAGIDYRADIGTPVMAAAAGRVIEISYGWAGGYGVSVVLDHGGGVTSRYAHLSRPGVGIGQTVSQGEIIARSGNSGRSTGPHLHFETRLNGRVISPF